MSKFISDKQWEQYERDGYLVLGKILVGEELRGLQQRIDDIMLGKAKLNYDKIMMQLDSDTGKYEDAGEQTRGHKGSHLNYRKIQDLEFDPLFLAYMQRPVFKEICEHVYGPQSPISAMRAMFMNKPAHKGTWLPWHQDRWTSLDRDPLITVWTPLDPATVENGCVQIIPGSHKALYNVEHHSGYITAEQTEKLVDKSKVVHLVLEAGEIALLHNWLLHASDVNRSENSRRAFSVCYMDAATRSTKPGAQPHTKVFGPGALTVDQLKPVGV